MTQQLINHGTTEGDGTGESPFQGMQKVNANFSELYTAKDAQASAIAAKAPIANPTFTGTVSGVTKAMVGLGNADNTPDATKPTSTPQQASIDLGDKPRLVVSDVLDDFVASGLVTPTSVNLIAVTTPGVAYVNGKRVVKLIGAGDLTFTYLATRDTYLDIDENGIISRTAVVNGAAAPAIPANNLRLCKVVTDADNITSMVTIGAFTGGAMLRDLSNRYPITPSGKPALGSLNPTGYDQTAEIQQYMNDPTGGSVYADLGAGEFIITGDLQIYSRKTRTYDAGRGTGLNLRGVAPEVTRIIDARASKATPAILLTDPTSFLVNRRNEMALIDNISFLAADTSGVVNPLGTLDGVGLMAKAVAGTGYGAHVPAQLRIERCVFNGYQYPLTLDDTTQLRLFDTRFTEFLTAIRSGGNSDLWSIDFCAFGSENFTSGGEYRNNAVCIELGWSSGVLPAGGENAFTVSNTWVMGVGDFITTRIGHQPIFLDAVYFEDVRRYYYAKPATPGTSIQAFVIFNRCHFSHLNDNDFTSNVKGNAGYGSKIQFDDADAVTTASSLGAVPHLTLRNCTGDGTPSNALVSFNNRSGRIEWENNNIPAHVTYGHFRCIRDGWERWRAANNWDSTPVWGKWSYGDDQAAGLAILQGDPITKPATIAAGSTYNLDHINGTHFELTLPDGDCTIDIAPYVAGPPSPTLAAGQELNVTLIVPASVAATRTITWGTRLKMNAANLTYGAADVNKRAAFKIKAMKDSGSGMLLVSRDPTFVLMP